MERLHLGLMCGAPEAWPDSSGRGEGVGVLVYRWQGHDTVAKVFVIFTSEVKGDGRHPSSVRAQSHGVLGHTAESTDSQGWSTGPVSPVRSCLGCLEKWEKEEEDPGASSRPIGTWCGVCLARR